MVKTPDGTGSHSERPGDVVLVRETAPEVEPRLQLLSSWTPHPPLRNVHPPARNQSYRAEDRRLEPSNVASGENMAAAASPSPSTQASMNASPTAMSSLVTGPERVGPLQVRSGLSRSGLHRSGLRPPPGTAGVSVRSNDGALVTIQIAATKTAIPTTPAAMRWFRRLRSRRRPAARMPPSCWMKRRLSRSRRTWVRHHWPPGVASSPPAPATRACGPSPGERRACAPASSELNPISSVRTNAAR